MKNTKEQQALDNAFIYAFKEPMFLNRSPFNIPEQLSVKRYMPNHKPQRSKEKTMKLLLTKEQEAKPELYTIVKLIKQTCPDEDNPEGTTEYYTRFESVLDNEEEAIAEATRMQLEYPTQKIVVLRSYKMMHPPVLEMTSFE